MEMTLAELNAQLKAALAEKNHAFLAGDVATYQAADKKVYALQQQIKQAKGKIQDGRTRTHDLDAAKTL